MLLILTPREHRSPWCSHVTAFCSQPTSQIYLPPSTSVFFFVCGGEGVGHNLLKAYTWFCTQGLLPACLGHHTEFWGSNSGQSHTRVAPYLLLLLQSLSALFWLLRLLTLHLPSSPKVSGSLNLKSDPFLVHMFSLSTILGLSLEQFCLVIAYLPLECAIVLWFQWIFHIYPGTLLLICPRAQHLHLLSSCFVISKMQVKVKVEMPIVLVPEKLKTIMQKMFFTSFWHQEIIEAAFYYYHLFHDSKFFLCWYVFSLVACPFVTNPLFWL